jgi:hypothetical protein
MWNVPVLLQMFLQFFETNIITWRKVSDFETFIIVIKSNISIIQRSQSKILIMIVDAPWYVSNATLHADLGISYVEDVIHQ